MPVPFNVYLPLVSYVQLILSHTIYEKKSDINKKIHFLHKPLYTTLCQTNKRQLTNTHTILYLTDGGKLFNALDNYSLHQEPRSQAEVTVNRLSLASRRKPKCATVTKESEVTTSQADKEIQEFQADMFGIPDWKPSQTTSDTQVNPLSYLDTNM